MLRYTLRVPNRELGVFNGFPITKAPKSGPGRVKIPWANDPPTVGITACMFVQISDAIGEISFEQ